MSASKALGEVKSFTKMFKNLAEILEEPAALEAKARKIDQEIAEKRRILEQLDADTVKAKAEAQEARKTRADLEGRGGSLITSAEASAASIVAKAREEAAAIASVSMKDLEAMKAKIADAKKNAETTITNAQADAKDIVRKARAQAEQVSHEITEKNDYLVILRSETTAAERQLAAVKAEIDRLRKQFAS